jgi:hypothetical protein
VSEKDHRKLACDLFNHTWTLLDLADRTSGQDDEMIQAALESHHHWSLCGTPLNLARGDWQIARVFAALGRTEQALYYARRCLAACESGDFGAFDLAFAHEAMARAYGVTSPAAVGMHIEAARTIGKTIESEDERAWLLENLDSLA